MRIKRPIILYPALLILLFILTRIRLYGLNPEWTEILIFITLNIAALILVFAGLNFIIKERLKTWLVTFLIFFIILFFNKIRQPFLSIQFLESKTSNEFHIVFAILIVLLTGISILILRYKGSLIKINQYLNLLLISLMVYQVYIIVDQSDTKKIKLATRTDNVRRFTNIKTDSLPDIYYIVLDAYTGKQSLKNYWNFDNSLFENFLIEKGFVIPSGSKTNYNMTPYSIASSLNMSYLTHIPNSPVNSAQEENLIKLVSKSQVVNTFLKNNYNIIDYSFFDIPDNPKYYNDEFFLLKKNILEGTAYEKAFEKFNKDWNQVKNAGLLSLKTINLDVLNKLTERNKSDRRPLFIYAHIVMPHEPYLFDEFGNIQDPDSAMNYMSKDRYLGQLKYLNKLVENTINKIFENNPGKLPVIIIQGDHGWRYLKGENQFKESATILNAYFFPDHDYRKIYSSISPVNTFRIIFNKYLKYNFELLKDTTYNVFVF
jgi:hypothetical protein